MAPNLIDIQLYTLSKSIFHFPFFRKPNNQTNNFPEKEDITEYCIHNSSVCTPRYTKKLFFLSTLQFRFQFLFHVF